MASVKGSRARWRAAAFAAVAGMLATVAACSHNGALRPSPATPLQLGYERAIRVTLPSVVQIDAGKSEGAGVVFDSKGDIVTNAHVVAGETKYVVLASDSAEPLPARLLGSFPPDDLAVIRVTKGVQSLRPARWANSDRAEIGELVLAMGNPFGLTDSVTQGIISAIGRTVTGETKAGKPPMAITNALQTSAAINPGNSGGALVLLSGDVIGIPTLSATNPNQGGTAEGIGFAIPANTVRLIANQLITHGRVITSERASLQVLDSTHTNSKGNPDGVSVDATKPGGAAAVAGIKVGDIITGLEGQATDTLAQLEDRLVDYHPGHKVKVDVTRNGSPKQFTVKLGSLSSWRA
jgi:putative serine protease PepD